MMRLSLESTARGGAESWRCEYPVDKNHGGDQPSVLKLGCTSVMRYKSPPTYRTSSRSGERRAPPRVTRWEVT